LSLEQDDPATKRAKQGAERLTRRQLHNGGIQTCEPRVKIGTALRHLTRRTRPNPLEI